MRAKLTQKLVTQLTAEGGRSVVSDTELKGLALRVMPGGQKSYLLIYRPPGSRQVRKWKFGSYPALTLAEARKQARKHLGTLAGGTDPAERKPEGETVQQAAEAWLKASTASERYQQQCRRLLARYIGPRIGKRPLASLTQAQVRELHRSLSEKPVQANRLLAFLSAVCGFACREGTLERNPCQYVSRFREHARERFLSADEFTRLGDALRKAESGGLPQPPTERNRKRVNRQGKPGEVSQVVRPADPFAVAALRLLCLTGARLGEILALKWSEVDPAGFLRLERSKTGRSIRPIGADALAVLAELPRFQGNPHVFPGYKLKKGERVGGPGHLTTVRALWEAVRFEAKLDGLRLHDLRHSAASIAAAGGDSLLLIGRLLGHKQPSTTARYAHLTEGVAKDAADRMAARVGELLRSGVTNGAA